MDKKTAQSNLEAIGNLQKNLGMADNLDNKSIEELSAIFPRSKFTELEEDSYFSMLGSLKDNEIEEENNITEEEDVIEEENNITDNSSILFNKSINMDSENSMLTLTNIDRMDDDDDAVTPRYKSFDMAIKGIATTVASMASGAVGQTLGLPTDIYALGAGIKDAIFADEGKGMEAFNKTFSEISKENLGSEYYKEQYNALIDSYIKNELLKDDAKSGFVAGQFAPLPTGVGAAMSALSKTTKPVPSTMAAMSVKKPPSMAMTKPKTNIPIEEIKIATFPENQKRWFLDSDTVTIYHGTSLENLNEVVNKGLKGDKDGLVYTSPDVHSATGYGSVRGGEKANLRARKTKLNIGDTNRITLKYEIPKKEFLKLVGDPNKTQRSRRSMEKLFRKDSKNFYNKTKDNSAHNYYEGTEIRFKEGDIDKYLVGAVRRVRGTKQTDDFNYLREGSTIRVDNPNFKDAITGESYVARKIRENNEFKKENPNTGPIGAFSGTTGFVDNIKFNPKELINFKGAAGEEKYRMSGLRMENLKKSIAEKGYIKADEGGDRILIHVTEDGTPYITEGNHRLAEAFMSKRPFISADIRYLRGGEAVDGPLNPKKIGIKTSDLTEQTSKKADPLVKEQSTRQIANTEYDKIFSQLDKAETPEKWQSAAKKIVSEERDITGKNVVRRTPALEKSARDLIDNKLLTRKEHLENIAKNKQIVEWTNLPRQPSSKAVVFSLDTSQRKTGLFLLSKEDATKLGVKQTTLKEGDLFYGRLDIPAYQKYDTWVVAGTSPAVKTADGKGVTTYAKAIHYTSSADNEPVKFIASRKISERIGKGQAGKTGYATIAGRYKATSEQDLRNLAIKLLDDPEWSQVGFDPRRLGTFYLRKATDKHGVGSVVTEADEVIQIGPLVLAKNVKIDSTYKGYKTGGLVTGLMSRVA